MTGVWGNDKGSFRLGEFRLDSTQPSFLIAEIGINHNGCLETAKTLIERCVWAGADCAKFQMRNMAALYGSDREDGLAKQDLGTQYILDILSKSQLTEDQMLEAFDYCRELGIMPLCTPWDVVSLEVLERYGMPAYKVASADLTNDVLLGAVAATGRPMILSTGMSSEEEIVGAVSLLDGLGASYVLLHCNSTYPAPFKDVQLRYLDRLAEISGGLVGYSGHERGYAIAIAAVARGAKVIEKHITLDRNMEGNDHKVSLLPDEFRAMVGGIRAVEEALSEEPSSRRMSVGERMNREHLGKSLVAKLSIREGTTIAEDMIDVRAPGKGLQPNKLPDLVGKKAMRDLAPGDFFYPSDVAEKRASPRAFSFRRPMGLPVRYHDYETLLERVPVDFLEFHLSYMDLDEDLEDFFQKPYDLDFTVHTPDLFPGDHILDLAAADPAYRARSVHELQRSLDAARELRPYFTGAGDRILVISSLGGFSEHEPIPPEHRAPMYERVMDSLSKLDTDGLELVAQTLPPFPWYRGGQLFCNLFVDSADTVAFCEESGVRLCCDVSHSKLTCNHRGQSLAEFAECIGPHIAHLHIVDAEGVDGEGLQIGDGEIDFAALSDQLSRHCPDAGFIPEIWQGHKNGGEGFWIALERLEEWF